MLAVHQDLGLDDRHQPRLLRERGVAGERVGVDPDRVLAGDPVADRDHGTPLGEPRAEPAVLGEAVTKAVEPLGHGLARGERERLRAEVDLDPRDDPLALEQLRERRAVGRALMDRLVEQDDAADVLRGACRREQEVAVGAAVLLRRLDPDRVQPALDRPRALVGGEDALPRARRAHGLSPPDRSRLEYPHPGPVQPIAPTRPKASATSSYERRLASWSCVIVTTSTSSAP